MGGFCPSWKNACFKWVRLHIMMILIYSVSIHCAHIRLEGQWLKTNGEAIYASKPWEYQNDTVTNTVWWAFWVISVVYCIQEVLVIKLHIAGTHTTPLLRLSMPSAWCSLMITLWHWETYRPVFRLKSLSWDTARWSGGQVGAAWWWPYPTSLWTPPSNGPGLLSWKKYLLGGPSAPIPARAGLSCECWE